MKAERNGFRFLFTGMLLVFTLVIISGAIAAETRGLRVVAKETATGETKEVKLYNKSYAVIIGIDQYQNLSMSEQLTYAVRDAKGVEEVLRKNFKFDKIITLYNNQATRDNILKVLMEDLPNEMTEEDSLFVFWAGHGNQETTRTGDLGYLVPYDGHIRKLQSNISMNSLKEDISKKLPAKHVFYVMDACYSGLLTATRALEKENKRDFSYLQEITREPVRQVLTAGGKNQKVLDGGPKGHSVFTGRLIEQLENAEDFITANELQAKVTEKVFSDARAMSATQTPGYGKLYGVGDFVFVPSLERKVEDTQGKIDAYQAEMDRLNRMEQDAARAQNDHQRRQVEIEKRQVEAKIAAEKLRQQTLEEQRSKREAEQREDERRQAEAALQKKDNEVRIARLSKDVAEKRKSLEGATLSSLSPQKTLDEMQSIDRKIKQIRVQFRTELKNGILQVVNRLNTRYLKLADARKDEFESEPEFQERLKKEKAALDSEQASEFTAVQSRLEDEYVKQIAPFIEELKKLSGQEFTITAENLTIELGTYDGASNTYPVSIKAKKPLEILLEEGKKVVKQVQAAPVPAPAQPAKKGKKPTAKAPAAPATKTITVQEPPKMKYIMLASNANIPLPRDEAREFKQHFQNNMLRAELKGNFETPETFHVTQAYIIDDSTAKYIDLFASKFVDLGDGTINDTETKLIWCKDGNLANKYLNWIDAHLFVYYLNYYNYLGCSDWRIPTKDELLSLKPKSTIDQEEYNIAKLLQNNGFNIVSTYSDSYRTNVTTWYTSINDDENKAWYIGISNGKVEKIDKIGNYGNSYDARLLLPVRDYNKDINIYQKLYYLFRSPMLNLQNSIVYDPHTKLIWSNEGTNNDITWDNARNLINRLNKEAFLGFRDWRMPTKEELGTLAASAKSSGYGNANATIATFMNREGFKDIKSEKYWTADLRADYSSDAWYVDFRDGEVRSCSRDCKYGPCGGSSWLLLPVRGKM